MGWFGYLTLFLYYVYFLYQMYKVEVSGVRKSPTVERQGFYVYGFVIW